MRRVPETVNPDNVKIELTLRNAEAELIVSQTAKLLQCSRWTKPYNKTVVNGSSAHGPPRMLIASDDDA